MQFNGYKKLQYPLWTLKPLLQAEGRLTEIQERFLAPCRPYEELYNLTADPHETANLACGEQSIDTLRDLSGRLDTWIEEFGDQGAIPEDAAVVAAEAQKMRDAFTERMNTRGLAPDIPDGAYLAWWERELL